MEKKFVSGKNESARMFKNDFLESLSKIHFSVPLFLFVPVVAFFIYKSFFVLNLSLFFVLALFAAGIVAWTFTEYVIHRFIFHYDPKGTLGRRIHFMIHGVHHDYPNDSQRLVLVPSVSIPLAILFYYGYYYIMGEHTATPFYAGFVAGYLFYDMTHYALHHANFKSKFWLDLKKHHMMHHYKDGDNGFGVSSMLWDYVFFTRIKKDESSK